MLVPKIQTEEMQHLFQLSRSLCTETLFCKKTQFVIVFNVMSSTLLANWRYRWINTQCPVTVRGSVPSSMCTKPDRHKECKLTIRLNNENISPSLGSMSTDHVEIQTELEATWCVCWYQHLMRLLLQGCWTFDRPCACLHACHCPHRIIEYAKTCQSCGELHEY